MKVELLRNELKKIRKNFPSKQTISFQVESGAGYGTGSAYSKHYVDEWLKTLDSFIAENEEK